jgi:hypothetical protein
MAGQAAYEPLRPKPAPTKRMKLDELVLQGASRRDDANHRLVEPGRVKFAALNRGVVPCSASGPPDERHAELLV